MVTLIAINLGYVVAGAITAEIVFNWPGLGTLTVHALDARDYPLLQGDLPADRGRPSCSPTSSPTSSTATSTRGCGHERHARLAAGTELGAERWRLRAGRRATSSAGSLGRTDGARRARRSSPCSRCSPSPRRCSSGRCETRHHGDRRSRSSRRAREHLLRHRRARPRHAQPDGPRRPDLDDDRAAGDADHDRRRRRSIGIVAGLRRRPDRQRC